MIHTARRHSAEIEELEKRANQAEMQLVSSKTTLELVKAQMRKDFDERFNDLFRQHKEQLGKLLTLTKILVTRVK
jgi:hypothetical protein